MLRDAASRLLSMRHLVGKHTNLILRRAERPVSKDGDPL
jgi:hypothetical protein